MHAIKNFNYAIENLNTFKAVIESCCAKMNKFQDGVNKFMLGVRGVAEVYLCKNFETKIRDLTVNPYWELQDWVNSEILDTKAMIEAIQRLSEYDTLLEKHQAKFEAAQKSSSELKEGKKDFFTMLKFKSLDEAIKENSIKLDHIANNISALKKTRKAFYHVVLQKDIFRFISTKSEIYQKCLRNYCENSVCEYQDLSDQFLRITSKILE